MAECIKTFLSLFLSSEIMFICGLCVCVWYSLGRVAGIETSKTATEDPHSFLRMGVIMWDTKSSPGLTSSNPFSEESTLKSNSVNVSGQCTGWHARGEAVLFHDPEPVNRPEHTVPSKTEGQGKLDSSFLWCKACCDSPLAWGRKWYALRAL